MFDSLLLVNAVIVYREMLRGGGAAASAGEVRGNHRHHQCGGNYCDPSRSWGTNVNVHNSYSIPVARRTWRRGGGRRHLVTAVFR